jgi:hypothetical protein
MNIAKYPLSEKTANSMRFCRHPEYECLHDDFAGNYAFKDQGSRFSVMKNTKSAPGPDECFAHLDVDDRPAFKKLLGMDLAYVGMSDKKAADLCLYNSMNYYRTHIEEFFYHNGVMPLPAVSGKCVMYYPSTDVLKINYELINHSDSEVKLKVRWFSVSEDIFPEEMEITKDGFEIVQHHKVLEKYDAKIKLEGNGSFKSADSKLVTDWQEVDLKGGECREFTFIARFALNDESFSCGESGKSLDKLVAETEKSYSKVAGGLAGSKQHESISLKAAGILRTLGYACHDCKGERRHSITAGKCGVIATWFWDSAFTMLGLGLAGREENGYGAARILLDGIKEDGTPPGMYVMEHYKYVYQQPILAWGIGHLESLAPSDEFLEYAYEPLCRYVKHWLNSWDLAGKGLSVYPPGGTCWDDSLRWQDNFPLESGIDKSWGEMHPEKFMNVDTNTHLYLECMTLAKMAAKLGFADESSAWKKQGQAIAEKINSELYDPELGIYQDKSVDGKFTGMITPSCFMPLYAGIAPAEVALRLSKDYLLNPERFYTILPFPTLDLQHPAFRGGGFLHTPPNFPNALVQQAYWRGRTWPHVSYWMVGAIYQAGLTAEADKAADRILEAMSKTESIHECYDPLTGYGNGHPEFAWSSSAVLALASRLYRKDPVADLS